MLIAHPGSVVWNITTAMGVMRYISVTLHSEKVEGSLGVCMYMPRRDRLNIRRLVSIRGQNQGTSKPDSSERRPRVVGE